MNEAELQLHIIFDTLGENFVLDLVENAKYARVKHPQFSFYEEQKFELLQEEFEEVREAFYTETPERTKAELLDVVTICMRWYNGE